MTNIMNLITANDCKIMDYIRTYNETKDAPPHRAIVIYGAALGAKRVIAFLEKNNIYPKHVVVDEKYYIPNQFLGNYEIERLDKVLGNKDEVFDVIIAIGRYLPEKIEKYKCSIGQIINYEIFYGYLEMGDVSTVSRAYYEANEEFLGDVYDSLGDELSRKSMISYLNQRISGESHYSEGLVQENQYFDTNLIDFKKQSLFVDCGAFDGHDSKSFFELTDDKSMAVVFEPEKENMKNVKTNLQKYGERVNYIEKGLLDQETVVYFNSGDGGGSAVNSSGDEKILCTALDDVLLVGDRKVSFIKMDIEGSELKALQGGSEIIKRDKPVLAICVYHRPDDIFKIPMYIRRLNSEYKFYMRRYDSHMIETVLYAI